VLVVDDEPQILRALNVILRQAGYVVQSAATVREALDALAVRPPEAMILDLVLPDGTGVDVLHELRQWSPMPVVVLSAVGDEREKVRALDAGADDYVTKPFGTEELLARLRAALRRVAEPATEPAVDAGPVRIDFAARRVTREGTDVHLTPIEFDLLRVLALHRGKLVTHRRLLQEVWGPQYGDETHYLRVHIAHIRAKLEDDPSRPALILTEAGVGYRMAA
jgi:two-component system KDP operon response regulator KdpE